MHACQFRCNDQRGGGSIVAACTRKQLFIVIRYQQANEEDREDEEEQNAIESLPDGRGDRFARVLRLTCSNGYQFGPRVGEAGLNQDRPEPSKLAESTYSQVLCESSRVVPVLETDIALLTSTSINANCEDDEANDSENLRQISVLQVRRPVRSEERTLIIEK